MDTTGHDERSHPIARKLRVFRIVASAFLWVFLGIYAVTYMIPRVHLGIIFLGWITVIYLLAEIEQGIDDHNTVETGVLTVLLGIVLACSSYVYIYFHELRVIRTGFGTTLDYVIGSLMLLTLIYLTYRSFGGIFVGFIVFIFGYSYFGFLVPGFFGHSGLSVEQILQISVTEVDGIYGDLTQLMAAWVALFLLYSGLIQGYRAFDVIMHVMDIVTDYISSGVPQVAVLGSMFIGSINGSAAANTAITGSVTIPLMKKSGLSAETAAAIESVASSGGQIMPPLMGAAALLMASFLGVSFFDIIVVGVLPALIFYVSVIIAVHVTASTELETAGGDIELTEVVDGDLRDIESLTIEAVRFGLPIVVLLVMLGPMGYTITLTALVTALVMIGTGVGFPLLTNRSTEAIRTGVAETIAGVEKGAIDAAPIAIVLAVINAMADTLISTGTPSSLALGLMELSGGVLIIAVLLAMMLCIVLGMGMPTSAAYVLVAILVVPGLVNNFALPDIAVHFFVFYSAILSALTPPIAVALVVACGIADSDFWLSAWKSIKIGAPIFVLPFVFIYHPQLLAGSIIERVLTGVGAVLGSIILVYGLNSGFELNTSKLVQRALQILLVACGGYVMVGTSDLLRGLFVFGAGSLYLYLTPTARAYIEERIPTS